MVLRRSVPAIVHTLGRISQGLGRIGANGTMVIRMRVESKLLGGLWLVRARARRGVGKRLHNHWGLLIYSLRRSRGAIGRYQGPTGAAWAAAGLLRRPTDGSDACPGSGKGLTKALELGQPSSVCVDEPACVNQAELGQHTDLGQRNPGLVNISYG